MHNPTPRNAAPRRCLRVLLASALSLALGFGTSASAEDQMWPGVTLGPANELLQTAVVAVGCTKDGFEAAIFANVHVSLSDIVKPGKTVDVEILEAALVMAEMTGDDEELREEIGNFDFRKVDSGRIRKIFEDVWKPVARKYTAAQLEKLGQDVQTDLLNTMTMAAQRHEQSTGVTIALEFADFGMSKTTIPRCGAAAPRIPG